jgi:hypothetical protein
MTINVINLQQFEEALQPITPIRAEIIPINQSPSGQSYEELDDYINSHCVFLYIYLTRKGSRDRPASAFFLLGQFRVPGIRHTCEISAVP